MRHHFIDYLQGMKECEWKAIDLCNADESKKNSHESIRILICVHYMREYEEDVI